jgi:hypothetical protein
MPLYVAQFFQRDGMSFRIGANRWGSDRPHHRFQHVGQEDLNESIILVHIQRFYRVNISTFKPSMVFFSFSCKFVGGLLDVSQKQHWNARLKQVFMIGRLNPW